MCGYGDANVLLVPPVEFFLFWDFLHFYSLYIKILIFLIFEKVKVLEFFSSFWTKISSSIKFWYFKYFNNIKEDVLDFAICQAAVVNKKLLITCLVK